VGEALRFFMDQHLPSPVSRALRRHGIEMETAQEAGRCGFSDADQLAYATSGERVLVTFDSDFLALHRTGQQHTGIAWCPEQKYNIGQLIQALLLLHGILDSDDMKNHVEYL
jgi:predicted nuclease of predicted toxin-antitoxin system